MPDEFPTHRPEAAAAALASAEALVITAGAGMGVDSGLPDFRGPGGFWRAYPQFAALGLDFEQAANAHWFDTDPALAWGFYGHRLGLYRATAPHAGFGLLRRWAEDRPGGAFVFTSNVDGHFRKAGFDEDALVECHGSIEWWQCAFNCRDEIWRAPESHGLEVDVAQCRLTSPLPTCPECGAPARPNVLMFGDGRWAHARATEQERRLERWLRLQRRSRLVVLELGAGTVITSVRSLGERLRRAGATLVRINPREWSGPPGTIALPLGARAGVEAIAACLAPARRAAMAAGEG